MNITLTFDHNNNSKYYTSDSMDKLIDNLSHFKNTNVEYADLHFVHSGGLRTFILLEHNKEDSLQPIVCKTLLGDFWSMEHRYKSVRELAEYIYIRYV